MTASAAEPPDHTTFAVFAAAAVALLTAFPADLLARNVVNRAPLDRDSLVTVRDDVLRPTPARPSVVRPERVSHCAVDGPPLEHARPATHPV